MIIIKRILPFVLLLLLVLITSRFLFFSGYLKIQKSIFRKEITSLSMKEVFVIKMTNNKLYKNIEGYEWKEKNKELVINGIYHEVISLKKNNGYSYISVIEDKAENQLFKRFFSTNKQLQDVFSDLIKLLLNITFIELNEILKIQIKQDFNLIIREHVCTYSFQLILKQIKPPQFL
jgi:hypothetical protein